MSVIHSLIMSVFKKFPQVVLNQQRTSKDAHDLEDRSVQFEVVLNDGNETVCDDGDVNLYAHRIFRLSPELFDTEMLFDPFEEEFHLPSVSVEQCDILGGKIKIVGVINKRSSKVFGVVNNSPKFGRVVVEVPLSCKPDSLVEKHAVQPIEDILSHKHLVFGLTFLPYDKESTARMDEEKPCEVEIAPVKHIAGRRLIGDVVHEFRVVHNGVGDSVEDGNFGDDVELCMDSDAGLGAPEMRPKGKRHTKVNGGGVNRIKPSMQFEFLCDASFLRKGHHKKSVCFENTRVSKHIRFGEHVPVGRRFAKTKMIGSFSMCSGYVCEFPECSASQQLPENECEQVVPVGKGPFLGPVETLQHNSSELPLRQKAHDLSENILSNVHPYSIIDTDAKLQISNHGQYISILNNCA